VLLYPATFLFLTSSWLVEQRYYVIPLAIFLLTRRHRQDIVEHLIVAIYACGSLSLFAGIVQGQFFL
jgi:alpha-1,2-glucosyltransferase